MTDRLKRLRDYSVTVKDRVKSDADRAANKARDYAADNKDQWLDQYESTKEVSATYTKAAGKAISDRLKAAYTWFAYSPELEEELKNDIEAQGALYRERLQKHQPLDTLMVGGESLARLLAVESAPEHIEAAFAAAYPGLAEQTNFLSHVSTLDKTELTGLLSGVKGKLFEQRYVEMLNSELLPDDYAAELATSATQPGWDIVVRGPEDQVVDVLQAKATDSVSYVRDAIEQYPAIDVVTTEEVYSHLVMTGISDGVSNTGLFNADLIEELDGAITAGEAGLDLMPPVITLAFIAYTSYKDENIPLYDKARSAGERSGAVYLAMLIGGTVGEYTDSLWLGVAMTIGTKLFGDKAVERAKMIETLRSTKAANRRILNRLEYSPP